MNTSDELRELSRQTRIRLDAAVRLRDEQRIITLQTERRLRESRALLDRASSRGLAAAPPALRRV